MATTTDQTDTGTDTRFLVVIDQLRPDDNDAWDSLRRVKRYLYGGSFHLSFDRHWSERRNAYIAMHILLVGAVNPRGDIEAAATNQADRLRSGPYQVHTFDRFAPAWRFDAEADR